MDVLSLDSFFRGLQARSYNGGALVFSITHPCFWPEHYGYASSDWFRYERETIIESPFRISADRVGSLPSTHLHRPLSAYLPHLGAPDLFRKCWKNLCRRLTWMLHISGSVEASPGTLLDGVWTVRLKCFPWRFFTRAARSASQETYKGNEGSSARTVARRKRTLHRSFSAPP
jgi:hypothetical protein